jgi:CRP-like cAMP-binding protein
MTAAKRKGPAAAERGEALRQRAIAALVGHPLLVGTTAEARSTIAARGRLQTFEPGEFLSREGDPAEDYWLLLLGSVRVFYTSPDGFEVTVKVFRAPAAWAEIEVLTGFHHIEDCVAVDRATALRLARAEFEALLDAHPRFMRNVLYDTCARFLIAAQNERALAFLPVAQRLAHLLLAYLRIYGVPVPGGIGLRIKLSQADLANGLGATRKSVVRTLAQWKSMGVIATRGASLVVLDPARLQALTGLDLVGID